MSEKPLVSVVIPVYNVENYLRQCMDSVVNQTYSNLEIVCVNDGSPDRSIDILRDYEQKDKRIRIVEIENQGLSGARNVGTSHCTGDYLLYLDSDDWIDLDTVEVALRAATENHVDIVLWNYVKEYLQSSQPVKVFDKETLFQNDDYKRLYQRLVGLTGDQLSHPEQCDSISTAWGKLYKMSIIKEHDIQYVDTKIIGTEDLLFNAEVFKYCNSAVALPNSFNHYRKSNASSLTRNFKPEFFKQSCELQRRLRAVCDEVDYLHQSLSNRTALSLIGLGLRVVTSKISFLQQLKRLKEIITTPSYKAAFKDLDTQYMPIHWKVFFFCAKNRLILSVWGLLKIMIGIIRHH